MERRSSDGQTTVKANVTYLLRPKRAQIYVQYYIIYLYIIYIKKSSFYVRN